MLRSLALPLALVLTGTLVSAAPPPSDLDDLGAAARQTWSRAQSTSGDVRAMADPISAGAVFVTNAADLPVFGAYVMPDLSGTVAWGNSTGITTRTGIRGALGVTTAGSGFLAVSNSASTLTWLIDGNAGLLSQAGDLAESFTGPAAGLEPGTVVVIDPATPGAVRASGKAYDRMVAGVVAGANGYRSAITLRALGAEAAALPVALTGTVYCRVTGPVSAGDLLTTSDVPGHAMRATDDAKARGAVLGKALQSFEGDRGLVLILASLQ